MGSDWKKLGRALLFPHMAIMILLLPLAAGSLIYTFVFMEDQENAIAYGSYAVSAYALTVWCFRIPRIIRFCKSFKRENRYARRWFEDPHLRVEVGLHANFIWNAAYAALQVYLAVRNPESRFWYWSLAVYYLSLSVMRSVLGRHTRQHKPGEQQHAEWVRYRACGWVFLLMNLALSGIIILMIRQNKAVDHGEIVTISMAAYTFITFTVAVVSLIKYRKYNSPVFSATKAISLAAACVSMLTLEANMLTTFDGSTDPTQGLSETSRVLFMSITGGVIVAFIITMAVYMILHSTKELRKEASDHGA